MLKPSTFPARARPDHLGKTVSIVIAHRGASGYLPEHTLEAYALGIRLGADYIEPDLVMTKDSQLIARHDVVLDSSTDVAERPEFASRKTSKIVDGVEIEGWFSDDFTLAEIKRLRVVERFPALRPANTVFNSLFTVPTLQEIINLVKHLETITGRTLGIAIEIKHPSYFAQSGLAMEAALLHTLHSNGYHGIAAPMLIESFETQFLRTLNRLTELPLVQLLGGEGQPYDVWARGGDLTYGAMATPEGLARITQYAHGVSIEKYVAVIPLDQKGHLDLDNVSAFVANAHAAGLRVYAYTFRAENAFLPVDFRSDTPVKPNPTATGNSMEEIQLFLQMGIDGFFIDQPDIGVAARDSFRRLSGQPKDVD